MSVTLTDQQLRAMMPNAGNRLTPHLPFINDALAFGEIDSPMRVAAFMAQLAHESGEYQFMEELASGDAYEGRLDLGNTEPGDGRRYKGAGLSRSPAAAPIGSAARSWGSTWSPILCS